jgi:hypothetical protein
MNLARKEILFDHLNRRIGEIVTQYDGRSILYDRRGRRLAMYDSKSQLTFSASGRRLGFGNLLTAELAKNA